VNARITALRAASVEAQPSLSTERALFFLATEAMKLHEGRVSTPVLRAMVFRHIMDNKRIAIQPGELIVGERGDEPLATPTYPELCCHSIRDFHGIHGATGARAHGGRWETLPKGFFKFVGVGPCL